MRNYLFTPRDKELLEMYFNGTVIDGLRQLKRTILTSQKAVESDYLLMQRAIKAFERKKGKKQPKTEVKSESDIEKK